MSEHHRADCTAIIGASGMGKGLYATERMRSAMRQRRPVLIWSTLERTDRYAEKLPGSKCSTIPGLVLGIKQRLPVIVFVPDTTGAAVKHQGRRRPLMEVQFDLFCLAAWHLPRGVVLVEELSRVTSPSWAPGPWQNLSTAGRHQGLTLLGTAQRPAQIDKDFLGNCTAIRAYRVNFENDARSLGAVFPGRPWASFLTLPDRHYLHRDIAAGAITEGIQPLPGEAPQKKSGRRAVKTP